MPSTEVKNRWNAKNYKPYRVHLRYDSDAELIKWVEDNKELVGISNIFRAGIEVFMEKEKEE